MEGNNFGDDDKFLPQLMLHILLVAGIIAALFFFPHPDFEKGLDPDGMITTTLAMASLVLLPVLLFIEFFVFYQEFPGFMDHLGLEKREVSLLLAGSVIGALMNVPVIVNVGDAIFLGMNVGGALIPVVLSLHLLWKNKPNMVGAIIAITVASICSYLASDIAPGLGIASVFPYFLVPAVVSFLLARGFEQENTGKALAVAYSAGTLGTLIGADIVRIPTLINAQDPIVGAIGGAGSMDLVFLAGLFAGGLVLITSPKKRWAKKKLPGEIEHHLLPKRFLEQAKRANKMGKYGLSIQYCKRAVNEQIKHTASRYSIYGEPEECLFQMRALPYLIHDYRVMAWAKATPQDAHRMAINAKLMLKDLRKIEREIYRGLGSRIIAYLIDAMILAGLILAISMPLFLKIGDYDLLSNQVIVILSTIIGIAWTVETTYFTVLEWRWGQTIGKKVMHMRVMDEEGGKCGFMAAFTRNVFRILDIATLASIIMIPFYIIAYHRSERKQRIGDFLGGTVVVKTR